MLLTQRQCDGAGASVPGQDEGHFPNTDHPPSPSAVAGWLTHMKCLKHVLRWGRKASPTILS
eukprot:scaffold28570_cov101-Isochrysis_galbana.AAC.2